MAEVWAAALTATAAVAGAGATVYSANKQAKAAKAGMGGGGGKFKEMKLPLMPEYRPVNLEELQKLAVDFDQRGYALSDSDFKRRHQPIVDAEALFEQQVLKDQRGEHELMPALQNEFVRAGLTNALSSFGSTPGVLAPGSAGEADVARNLGLSIMGFQDRNRENRTKSLVVAEELFPRRKFGLSGSDAAGVMVANLAGMNNWNQADYANRVQQAQYNATGQANFTNAATQQANVNAQAGAQANAARTQAIISAAEMAAKLGTSYAAQRPSTTTPATSTVNTTGWKSGPQPGTYYVPKTSVA